MYTVHVVHVDYCHITLLRLKYTHVCVVQATKLSDASVEMEELRFKYCKVLRENARYKDKHDSSRNVIRDLRESPHPFAHHTRHTNLAPIATIHGQRLHATSNSLFVC